MSISLNPFSSAMHFVEQKALPFLDHTRDTMRNGMVNAWNKMPGNEAAESMINKVVDKMPFNNAASAAFRALAGQKEITLDKDATDGIQADPDFAKKEQDIVGQIQKDDRYGQQDFEVSLSDLYKDDKGQLLLELGGQRGDMGMKDQLLHAWDLKNPDIQKTWKVAGNEQTWLLRHCTLSGTAHVSKDGTIKIDYKVRDTLDLSAQPGREGAYNGVSKVLGGVWHGMMGAEKPEMTGTFSRTVAGTGPAAAQDAGGDVTHTAKYVP